MCGPTSDAQSRDMFRTDAYIQPEIDYRRTRARRAVASSKRRRSRTAWLRALDAADKPVR